MSDMDDLMGLLSSLEQSKFGDTGNLGKHLEIMRLINEGTTHYYNNEHEEASLSWQKAYQVAAEVGDEKLQSQLKVREGDSLFAMGRLRESLTCYMEMELLECEPTAHWSALIKQAQLASRIPLPLDRIVDIIHKCKNEMEQEALYASRSMLLVTEADLASKRHDLPTKLAKMQEAMGAWDGDASPQVSLASVYVVLIEAYLDMGDSASAKKWLERFEGIKEQNEQAKEQFILRMRLRMALLEHDFVNALDYALKLKTATAALDAFISIGVPQLACTPMARILIRNHRKEDAHERYECYQYAGDWHRANDKGISEGKPRCAKP